MHREHHLQDDHLFDVYMAERHGIPVAPPDAEHLTDCAGCAARYGELTAFLETLRTDGEAEADEIFTPERLRAQARQIAERVDHLNRPARVISFPGRIVRRTITASTSRGGAPRWVAAAAAAGLFVGVALGASDQWGARERPRPQSITARSAPVRLAPVATRGTGQADPANDDAFLSDLEIALERPHLRELQAFDALTPHVREVRAQR